MSSFPKKCIHSTKGERVVVSEKKRRFVLNNPNRLKIRKVNLDGCAIAFQNDQKACDFGLWVSNRYKTSYLIELKGKAIVHACRQILETLRYLREHYLEEIADRDIFPVIVCSANTVPKLHANPHYIRLRKEAGRAPFIQSGQVEQTC
jgi:hypothetical protein